MLPTRSGLRPHHVRYRPAVAPVPGGVLLDRPPQITAIEVGPQSIKENQLRVRALPEQEVGRSLLSRRADEQIDVGDVRFVEVVPEALLGELARIKSSLGSQLRDSPRGVDDFGN